MKDMPRGDFGKLGYDSNDIEMLDDAFKAIQQAEMWGFLANTEFESFMFHSPPEIKRIDALLKYEGHSGSSYGWTMRTMESIAKNGWETFCLLRLKRMRMNAW